MTSRVKMEDTTDGLSKEKSCHDNTNKDVAGTSSNAQGFRRSSRRRVAPPVFVPQQKRKVYRHWSPAEKFALLRYLNRLNNREIPRATVFNRYPYGLIKKHIKTKSLDDIRMILSRLERRGAAAALLRMKQQSPIESWCKMADNLTVLTGDDSSRHLIRVCRVMALESIDDDGSDKKVKVTKKKFAASDASDASPNSASASTSADTSTTQNSISTSERTLTASSSEPEELGTYQDAIETPCEDTTGKPKKKIGRPPNKKVAKKQEKDKILGDPDYESIYKYIGGLMQGEQKEIGGLESLVVLDCLKSIEVQLKGRNNAEQKNFVQKRFVDILQNLYLTVNNDGDNAVGVPPTITTEDLIGSGSSQSQARSDKPVQSVDSNTAAAVNQSEGTFDGQSASDSGQPSQSQSLSHSSMQQTVPSETAHPKADPKKFKTIGLGSINPFNVPVKLLEIRKDR
ncbi:uncharacterized protein [Asterias amurensis]|uniref:uncharacterized protein n=1 Tax=Asterias amurensis TaxID=7602 RepID=UPI003AB4EA9B